MKTKHLFLRLLLFLAVWAVTSQKTMAGNSLEKYWQYNINVSTSPTGLGKVYINGQPTEFNTLTTSDKSTETLKYEYLPSGYFFLGWSKDRPASEISEIVSVDNPSSFTVHGYYRGKFYSAPNNDNTHSTQFYANFTCLKAESQNEDEGSAVILDLPIESPIQVSLGDDVRLMAVAEAGYKFKEWRRGDVVVSTDNPYSVHADLETAGTYTAFFEACTEVTAHQVIIETCINGTIVSSKETAVAGEDIYLTPTADAGYETTVARYNSINADKISDGRYVFTMPNDNAYISLMCKPITYTINFELDGGSLGILYPMEYTVETETFTLSTPSKEGYTFAGWKSADLTEPTTTVTIAKGSTGNRVYTAKWTEVLN